MSFDCCQSFAIATKWAIRPLRPIENDAHAEINIVSAILATPQDPTTTRSRLVQLSSSHAEFDAALDHLGTMLPNLPSALPIADPDTSAFYAFSESPYGRRAPPDSDFDEEDDEMIQAREAAQSVCIFDIDPDINISAPALLDLVAPQSLASTAPTAVAQPQTAQSLRKSRRR
ncbi:hypothetical protein B0H19DRAFT_1261928 [Mycena capillaripes]|nr:hypothetical protein B0H19DRAFT_1261928 [Mycena capillaripes]